MTECLGAPRVAPINPITCTKTSRVIYVSRRCVEARVFHTGVGGTNREGVLYAEADCVRVIPTLDWHLHLLRIVALANGDPGGNPRSFRRRDPK